MQNHREECLLTRLIEKAEKVFYAAVKPFNVICRSVKARVSYALAVDKAERLHEMKKDQYFVIMSLRGKLIVGTSAQLREYHRKNAGKNEQHKFNHFRLCSACVYRTSDWNDRNALAPVSVERRRKKYIMHYSKKTYSEL